MKLLELSPARVSLEFTRAEWPAVLYRLRKMGRPSRDQHATYDNVIVANEAFILVDEWDEPCLISQSEAGDAILRTVANGSRLRASSGERRKSFRNPSLAGVLAARLTRLAA